MTQQKTNSQNNMEKEIYKNEIFMAVTLLLCLWFKLDAVIEYGIDNVSLFSVASCGLLLTVLLFLFLWLLLTNRRKLWIILKGIISSNFFDTISWIAFLMPIICIDSYNTYFACASWILGDVVLLGGFMLNNRKKIIK